MGDFDKLFKITITALNVVRLNPYIKRDKTWALQYMLLHGLYTCGYLVVTYNILYDIKIKDYTQACKNCVLFVVYIQITFQCGVLLYHRRDIIKLMEDVRRDYELLANSSEEERKVMTEYAKKGVVVSKQWVVVACGGAIIFPIKNVILYIYYYVKGDTHLVPFYELVYPDVIVRNIPDPDITLYSFNYVLMLFFDFFSGVSYVAFAPLGPMFLIHACSQLELVKGMIHTIFDERDDEVIHMKIRNIILQLNSIYSFVERIKECFKMTYELTLKATTLMLPIACFEVIESLKRGEFSLEFVTFIIGGCLIIASPCFYSDLLMEKGEEIRLAIYTCGWECHYDLRVRSTLKLLLQRALRPIAIRTLFRTICLEALTDLFQQGYAIFNVMNATLN